MAASELSEPERIRVEAFGLDKPDDDATRPFLVHMEGPDDLRYFGSWVEACEFAHGFNESVLEYNEQTQNPGMVRGWAIPYKTEEYEDRWNKILAKPAQAVSLPDRTALVSDLESLAIMLGDLYPNSRYAKVATDAVAALSTQPAAVDCEGTCDYYGGVCVTCGGIAEGPAAGEVEWAARVSTLALAGPVYFEYPDRLSVERFIKDPPLWFDRQDVTAKVVVSRTKAGPWVEVQP